MSNPQSSPAAVIRAGLAVVPMRRPAMMNRAAAKPRTAVHRPAKRRRRFRHDEDTAVDLFSGFGGLTQGIEAAGFTAIMAANHNEYKVSVHEKNHPKAEHWIADLVDPEASDYHSARDLPAADLLAMRRQLHQPLVSEYAEGLRGRPDAVRDARPGLRSPGHTLGTGPRDRELRTALRAHQPPTADPGRVHDRAHLVGPGPSRQNEDRRRHDVQMVAPTVREPELRIPDPVPELDVLRRAAVARPPLHRVLGQETPGTRPGPPAGVVVRPVPDDRRSGVDVEDRRPAVRVGALRRPVPLHLPVLPSPGVPADNMRRSPRWTSPNSAPASATSRSRSTATAAPARWPRRPWRARNGVGSGSRTSRRCSCPAKPCTTPSNTRGGRSPHRPASRRPPSCRPAR